MAVTEDPHAFARDLLAWYDAHQRTMPWRYDQPDPYHVWLSEIMLQQTTVATVGPYFDKFIEKWPTVQDLAKASQDDVLHMWQGLGYYARARNLHKCAQVIVSAYGGKFPATAKELEKLPGVGPYASAAIASIAFCEPVAVVDGNIVRVMARVAQLSGVFPKNRPAIVGAYLQRIDAKRSGDFAQALMDLSQMICRPQQPKCLLCPVRAHCQSYQKAEVDKYPEIAQKKEVPQRTCAALIITNAKGEIYLQKRPDEGLLGGLYEVPTLPAWDQKNADVPRETMLGFKSNCNYGRVKHGFSHLKLTLDVFGVDVSKAPVSLANGKWVDPKTLGDFALSRLMQKVLSQYTSAT